MIKTKHGDVTWKRFSGKQGSEPCKCLEKKSVSGKGKPNAKAPKIGICLRCLQDRRRAPCLNHSEAAGGQSQVLRAE